MPFLLKLAETTGWSIFAVVIFYGCLRLFDTLDPIDYRAEIRDGNVAAGIIMAAIVFAIAAIIIAVILSPE